MQLCLTIIMIILSCHAYKRRSSIYFRLHPRVIDTAPNYEYNLDDAEVSLWLSAASYCSQQDISTRVFLGPTHGFVVTKLFYNIDTGAMGYIGFLNRKQRIYVVFQGTHSIADVLSDIHIEQVPYATYPECECNVHKGFMYLSNQLSI